MPERSDELQHRLDELAARVAALEAVQSGAAPPQPAPGSVTEPAPGELDVDLLQRLQGREGTPFDGVGAHGVPTRGSVLYAGAATVAGGSYLWQMERPVPGLLAVDDDLIARTVTAIASPTRIRLLKAVLGGANETHQLQAALGEVSTGQLYHHLKELTAIGLVIQRGRGRYEIAAHAVVPLLAMIAAAFDLAAPAPAAPAPDSPTPNSPTPNSPAPNSCSGRTPS